MARKPPPIKANVALESLQVVYVPTEELKPNDYNPNRMSEQDFELLLRSMREDGFTQPIVARAETKVIVDGEHRWRAGAQLGMPKVPVVFVPMSDAQARIATLRHNRARGSEDLQLAAEVLRDLEKLGALDWAADSLMLSDAEIDKLLADVSAPDGLAGEEYTAAWTPKPRLDADGAEPSVTAQDTDAGGIVVTTAMSMQALEAQRQHEKRIAEARTEEEKELVRKDRIFYRINLMFSDAEAEIVKRVLGDKPAERLLAICQRELEAAA